MSTKGLEIEYKYRADNISLTAFTLYCKKNSHKFVHASGYDIFYAKNGPAFFRHRLGPDINQLTFKRKLSTVNNVTRVEHNINLGKDMTQDEASAFCQELGYEFNFSIFKNCFIFEYNKHTFVFYICYDLNMQELGRFVEIEMSEDYPWQNAEEAVTLMKDLEGDLKQFGITPQHRVKNSLFEMFRRED